MTSTFCRLLVKNQLIFSAVNKLSLARQASTVFSDEDFNLKYLDGNHEGVAVFSMTRHKTKNAMSKNLLKQFQTAIKTVKFDNAVRVVIVRSEVPGAFCAGGDLKERLAMTEDEVRVLRAKIHEFLPALMELPMPTLAAIDGHAMGGGFEMAMACDIIIAASKAKMALTETRLAIIPGGGGTQRLSRLVGPSLAKELIFTARILDGKEAYRLGILNHVADQNDSGDAAYQRALQVAEEILPNGPVAVRAAKLAVNKGIDVDISTGLAIEQACYAQVIPTKDRIEGLMAFKEKRKPHYTGH